MLNIELLAEAKSEIIDLATTDPANAHQTHMRTVRALKRLHDALAATVANYPPAKDAADLEAENAGFEPPTNVVALESPATEVPVLPELPVPPAAVEEVEGW